MKKGGGQKRLGRKKGKHKKNKKMPFFFWGGGGKQGFSIKNKERKGTKKQKNQKTQTKKTNKEGLGPSEVETTKPKKQKKKKNKKKQKILKNELFSYQWNFSSFLGGCPKFPFFWQLGPKSAHPKNTIKIGVSGPFFWKADVRHETAIFGPQKPKFINSGYHFFCLLSSLSTTQNTKNCWNPYL